jgi:hypothetical protein
MEGKYYNGTCRNGMEGLDWIHLAQDRDQWQALENAVINLTFHKRQGFS